MLHYKKLGKTGIKASILGFGALRLPKKKTKRTTADQKESIKIIRQAIDGGINFIDTAYNYMGSKSEIIVGKALQDGYRDKVTLMTKSPVWEINSKEDFHRIFEEQLERLQTDYLDIYLFHNLRKNRFQEKVIKYSLIDEMKKLKDAGKIKHFGFSSHDTTEKIREYIDTGEFEVILLQYNFLDPHNKIVYEYATEKGLGTLVMGPVGGGRLAMQPTKEMKKWLSKGRENFADLALKYVWSDPNIDVVLSGMSSAEMIKENIALASSDQYTLSKEESERVAKVAQKFNEIYDLDCSQCGYCEPCPSGVSIKLIMKLLMTSKNPLDLGKARTQYRGIGLKKSTPGEKADACIECGECLDKCPQDIPIIKRLKEAHSILSEE